MTKKSKIDTTAFIEDTNIPYGVFVYKNDIVPAIQKLQKESPIEYFISNESSIQKNYIYRSFFNLISKREIKNKEENLKYFIDIVKNTKYDDIDFEEISKKIKNISINEKISSRIIEEFTKYYSLCEINHKKVYFSLLNLISKIDSFEEVDSEINIKIDAKTSLFGVDITRNSNSGYLVNINLQFCDNGSVNYFVSDTDKNDNSHIRGSVTRYSTYKSSSKFRSIINLAFYGG